MSERNISRAVISRLPRYYRYLGDLMRADVERISSGDLAKIMKVTASQIRQDFNTFGGFGQQGYGYNVKYLYEEMGKILGVDHDHKMIIVGAGNLARAFTNYIGFNNIGFYIAGLFDNDSRLIGQSFNDLTIMPMAELPSFVKNEKIDLGILAVPKAAAHDAALAMIEAGIKNIWNFVPTDLELDLPEDVFVQNEHLSDSLMQLSYNIAHSRRTKQK